MKLFSFCSYKLHTKYTNNRHISNIVYHLYTICSHIRIFILSFSLIIKITNQFPFLYQSKIPYYCNSEAVYSIISKTFISVVYSELYLMKFESTNVRRTL